jgi:hypothetical protein
MRTRKDPSHWFVMVQEVLANPETSDWLKSSLLSGINVDPVTAAKGGDVLARIFKARAACIAPAAAESVRRTRTPKGNGASSSTATGTAPKT